MNTICLGAITGDIVGSIYEFDNHRSKDFSLFGEGVEATDDSILTIATMEALMRGGAYDDYVNAYYRLGNQYPSSYGERFSDWLYADTPKPYDSWGNGAPMRVSPVAWFYDTIEEVQSAAKVSAEVTHNHPNGVKGAQSVASAVFLARIGKSKEEIKKYIETTYGYFLDFTLDDIRASYEFDVSSDGTVPPAIVAFLEATDFEDAIRNAISIGGDSDTLAAITGSIAEAHYGIPETIQTRATRLLPALLRDILNEFSVEVHKKGHAPDEWERAVVKLTADDWGDIKKFSDQIKDAEATWSDLNNQHLHQLIRDFLALWSRLHLVVPFDWSAWTEGRDWYEDSDANKYEKLDSKTALKLLTAVIRNDRFNEGALEQAFLSGDFPKIINQLILLNSGDAHEPSK